MRWLNGWMVLLCVMFVTLAGTCFAYAEQPQTNEGNEPIQEVHTIYWKAHLHANVKKNGRIVLHSGQSVVVVNRNYNRGGRSLVKYDEGTVRVPNGCLGFYEDLCTSATEGDYNRTTKLWYVNEKRRLHSRTNYLIWVSLDKQRVNVFTRGADGKWEIVKELKCSTGLPESPSRAGLHKCDFKELWFRGCNFYVEYGGSGIHKWVRSDYKDINKLGKHTASQSCIRLVRRDAKWLYKLIPVNTTILVW